MEKAPGSGGPAAGKPAGVKSGEQQLREIKAEVQAGNPPEDQVAPAEATIRATSKDGTADAEHEKTADTQAEATENLAEAEQKLDKAAERSAAKADKEAAASKSKK